MDTKWNDRGLQQDVFWPASHNIVLVDIQRMQTTADTKRVYYCVFCLTLRQTDLQEHLLNKKML